MWLTVIGPGSFLYICDGILVLVIILIEGSDLYLLYYNAKLNSQTKEKIQLTLL